MNLTVQTDLPPTAVITVSTSEMVELAANAKRLAAEMPEITNNEACQEAKELMREIGALSKQIDARRKEVKKPYLAVCELIDEQARPLIEACTEAVAKIKTRLADYAMAVERARITALVAHHQHEQAAAAEAAETGRTPAINTQVVVPDAAPVSTRREMYVQVLNVAEIPREFMVPNLSAIEAEFKAGRQVPGCAYLERRIIVNR